MIKITKNWQYYYNKMLEHDQLIRDGIDPLSNNIESIRYKNLYLNLKKQQHEQKQKVQQTLI